MKITNVRINGLLNPVGYDYSNGITVSWNVEGTASKKQKETIVNIAADESMSSSSVVDSAAGILPCCGVTFESDRLSLKPRTIYYVQVIVESEDGESAVSDIASFETGKMGEGWAADWIGVDETCEYHPVLYTEFETKSDVKKARLYITGVGLYEACIDGRKAGNDFLAPFFNDYNSAIQVQTYDVTDYIADNKNNAKNKIEILLGNGWYKGRLGYEGGVSLYGKQFGAIAELYIEYTDGTSDVVVTNTRPDDTVKTGIFRPQWKAEASDITYSDIYDGEGWDRTIYKDERPDIEVVDIDFAGKTLTDRYSMPVHVMEELSVKEIIITPKNETVLDFGQNFAGYVSFHTKSLTAGTKVTLEHGEILQDGNFYHDNYRSAKTLITYVSDGRDEWFSPHFTFIGFRYVKVNGWNGAINKEDFVGKVVYSAMEQTGFITTGHEKVNRLISNALWGLKSNFIDVPTDCPQRDERLGWTGDAQVFAPTACFFMDTKAFYRKYLWDMRNDQVKRGGTISSYVPNIDNGMTGAAVWADAATFIPETIYNAYGDKALLNENYPMMKDWIEFILKKDSEREGGPKYLYDFAFTFGDWLAMDGVTSQSMKGGTDDEYVASVYYYASVCKVINAANVLCQKEDVVKYTDLAEKIKNAILDEYFAPNGRLTINTQTAYIIALYFGIYRDKDVLIRDLKKQFKKNGNRIKGGFVGAPLTCITLADNGMNDLAMHIFLQERFPSWLHCVNLGATTIWERWNSVLDDGKISGTGMNSLNHYSYGSVVNFVVRNVVGLTPLQAGYKRVKIEPKPDARLRYVELDYASASGKYAVNWRICDDGKLDVHIEIPFDCEAEVVLPDGKFVDMENTVNNISNSCCKDGMILTAGCYDFMIETACDYRKLYSMDTTLEELSDDKRAMEILKELLPPAYGMACGDDIESLSITLNDLKYQPWFGCNTDDVDSTAKKLFELEV